MVSMVSNVQEKIDSLVSDAQMMDVRAQQGFREKYAHNRLVSFNFRRMAQYIAKE